MSNIKFSLNVYIAEEMELDICLKSIFEENKRELAHMQVLLLDACNDRDTKEVIAKYKEQYGSAITYVDCKGLSQAEAYNKAKELWTGEYIAFITGNIQYAEGALVEVEHFIKKHDASIVSLVPRFYNANGAAKKYLKFGRYDEMVDLTEDIYKVNLFANGYFIRKDITAKLEFNPAIIHNAMECYLIHALEMEKTYGIVPKLIYTHTPPEVDYYNYADQYYKTWYTDHVRTLIIPILEEDHARFVQFSMLYLLMIKFACNMNDRHKAILNKAELDEFMESIKDALQLIDDDIISQYDTPYKRVLPRFMGLNLLRVKYDEYDLKTEMKEINDPFTDEPTVAGVYKDTVIESFNNVSLYVKAINYDKGELVIDGEIANVYFLDYDAIQVTAEVEGKKVVGTRNYIYSLVKYFNQSVRRGYTFQIKIPVEHITGKTKFNLMLNYAGHTMPLPISSANTLPAPTLSS